MTRKASILVLDADPAFTRLVEETLTSAGHQLTSVDQEADALAKVRGQAFDMAIVDLERSGTGAAFLEGPGELITPGSRFSDVFRWTLRS